MIPFDVELVGDGTVRSEGDDITQVVGLDGMQIGLNKIASLDASPHESYLNPPRFLIEYLGSEFARRRRRWKKSVVGGCDVDDTLAFSNAAQRECHGVSRVETGGQREVYGQKTAKEGVGARTNAEREKPPSTAIDYRMNSKRSRRKIVRNRARGTFSVRSRGKRLAIGRMRGWTRRDCGTSEIEHLSIYVGTPERVYSKDGGVQPDDESSALPRPITIHSETTPSYLCAVDREDLQCLGSSEGMRAPQCEHALRSEKNDLENRGDVERSRYASNFPFVGRLRSGNARECE
ncbi:hypothetical protein R3P38DRAFT_2800819 [Favolaschia claudopus]|uniref:Uncharacterized protein n=1 Tax=Favolaschia claudopus TaxID=2862362 RepID=A0AAV9ZX78_9AGAR